MPVCQRLPDPLRRGVCSVSMGLVWGMVNVFVEWLGSRLWPTQDLFSKHVAEFQSKPDDYEDHIDPVLTPTEEKELEEIVASDAEREEQEYEQWASRERFLEIREECQRAVADIRELTKTEREQRWEVDRTMWRLMHVMQAV